jgi:hypothetical protein
MTFEEWYEENFGAVEPGVPFHLPVLKFAYESGAKKREWVGLATGEAREFYESDLSREELIHKIDEFLEEKNT